MFVPSHSLRIDFYSFSQFLDFFKSNFVALKKINELDYPILNYTGEFIFIYNSIILNKKYSNSLLNNDNHSTKRDLKFVSSFKSNSFLDSKVSKGYKGYKGPRDNKVNKGYKG